MLTAFKQYLTTLKLSPVSRKLYLSDVRKFLSWIQARTAPSEAAGEVGSITLSQVTSPKVYSDYLASLKSLATAPSMIKRTLASLKQFSTFLALTYSIPNPVLQGSELLGVRNLVSAPTDNYIKHFSKYLNASHLSPLTIKSYKSDVSRYLDWGSSHLPSTDITELLRDKNIQKYLNHLSVDVNILPSTIERKEKSLTRFQAWYSTVYAPTYVADNNTERSHTRYEGLPHTGYVIPIGNQTPAPGKSWFSVKKINSRTSLVPNLASASVRNFAAIVVLLLFAATLAIFGYRQFNRDVRLTAAYPSTPVTPNRQLSFQGRLENASGTPITTATNFVFKLFTASSGGSELYSSGTCSITPDTDGVFNTQIGDTCGTGIASSVFTENQDVWLEVTVAAETLTPRQQIATVAYALNSETIQGFPISSTVSAIRNTLVPMNQWGEIIVGEQSPRMTGVSGTFAISAPALTLSTTTGSNGNITLAPDGTGQINFNGNTTSTNFFNVSNAQLTTGSLITGTVANNNTGFKLFDLLSGTSPTSKFSVSDAGNVTLAGDLTITGDDLFMTTNTSGYLLIADGTNYNPTAISGDITLTSGGVTTIGADKITEGMLKSVNGPTDELCLSYESTVGDFEWQTCGSGGGSNWRYNLGTLSPLNDTVDLLVGGNATSSAKAGFLNINNGTPTATVSAGAAGAATLSATGFLGTTAMQTLTLGNSTTGNVVIAPGGTTALTGIGANLTAAGNLTIAGTTGLTFSGSGGDITFTNLEKIDNDIDGTLNLTTNILKLTGGTSMVTDQTSFDLFNTTTTTLNVAGAATTLNLAAGGALTRAINIGTGTGVDTINIGTGGTTTDDINIGGLSTSHLDITGVTNFAGSTTYFVDASGNAKFLDLQVADTGNAGLTVGNGNTGFAKIGSFTIGDNSASVITFDANSDATPEFQLYNTGSATASGDVTMGGQLQVGRFAATPTAVGTGAMIFNTTTSTHQCYNGTTWYNCGGTLYSNSNASVADGSYLTVAHNLATNDLLSSAWINAQGVWKSLESSYQPAIAWEGKDTQKGNYHNVVNSYVPIGNETGTGTSTLHDGLVFDTLEDTTKTDSANTTASLTQTLGDDGSSNLVTLDQRVQAGRTGLLGGQTYDTATNDNDGQAYLGSNTVNDIYYYDRSKDSTPEVLVELGIDPNWYNGVTLSVATSSAQYSQNSTLTDKNPNLTTTYNGSLIKAAGTDTTPRTIFITIKSPTTFDWTNYQGDAATGTTITPGTAQTLGVTGVSVTFTAANYNVGDVFKIASWYIEASGSTRGSKQQFPERSNIIATASSVDIVDADTQKLWMRFSSGASYAIGVDANNDPSSTTMLNGHLYFGKNGSSANGLSQILFGTDTVAQTQSTTYYIATSGNISLRNSALFATSISSNTYTIVTNVVNDVSVAVIPNQVTQEMTVSGWGYIVGNDTGQISETISLPYKFNNYPIVTTVFAGSKSTTPPATLQECTGAYTAGNSISTQTQNVTQNNFLLLVRRSDAVTFASTSYHCYTWTSTGTVSPKQFVAVATGTSTADGGTTIINETEATKADMLIGSQTAGNQWQNKIALTSQGKLYAINNDSNANITSLVLYKDIPSLISEATYASHYAGGHVFGLGIPAPLGTASGTGQGTSLSVIEGTSTVEATVNTIYVGSTSGASVIQEKSLTGNSGQGGAATADGSEEQLGSVKYYTKDYISEEMIGDIRGMWGLYDTDADIDTAETTDDVSIKNLNLTANNANSTGFTSTSGVRGEGVTFDGTDDYFTSADNASFSFSNNTMSASYWVKRNGTPAAAEYVLLKGITTWEYASAINTSGQIISWLFTSAGGTVATVTSNRSVTDNNWHHVAITSNGATMAVYIDGILDNTSTSFTSAMSDTASSFFIGDRSDIANSELQGSLDEVMLTATALTEAQVRNMYQTGYRALQSHGTGLGGGAADTNQQFGYISTGTSSVGVVAPDYNNQYMYVGTNSTTLGALSKIQLNSDTNIKTYNSSANVPAGGSLLIDEDVTSLAVGETLLSAGSAASGVKSMGVDNNSTATSGNYVSKTYALPKNIGSAVLWVSPILDASDGSNTLVVKASNDGGSTYATCTLVNTNSNPPVPEKEYACTFSAASNSLKVKFEFARGSTKTNTYVTQYGISWLGETGFRVEQADTNNVRLYNFSGEAQNLRLNVTGASTAALANPWTDGGSYLYPTGYESLRVYDGGGTNYLGIRHDGTNGVLTYNGTDFININSAGDILPETDDTQSLGSSTLRWKDIFLGPATAHIGTSTTDEGTISYDTSNNIFQFDTDTTSNADIAFFTDDLYLDKSTGNIGIGDTTPSTQLDVLGTGAFNVGTSVLTGSIDPIASTTVTGVGTLFLTQLVVGDRITVTGVTKTVTAIATNTSLTVDSAFTDLANDTAPDKLDVAIKTASKDNANAISLQNADNGGTWNIRLAGDGTSSNNFYLDNTNYGTTNLAIRSTGMVGIGVSPSYTLDVGAPAAGQNALRIDSQSGGSDYSAIHMARGGTTRFTMYIEPSTNNLYFLDANDNQAVIRNDLSALNDDGWATSAVDYGEFMKKQNPQEDIKPFEVVGIKDGLVTKDTNNATMYMVTSSDAGIRGGNSLENSRDNDPSWIVVAYTGQVPVLVNQEAKNGDLVIPSGLNDGKAIAVSPDQITSEQYRTVIGLVLNEFDPTAIGNNDGGFETEVQRIIDRKGSNKIANIAVGVRIGGITMDESGDIQLHGTSLADYSVSTNQGLVSKVGAFAQATVASLTAGLTSTRELQAASISPLAPDQPIVITGPVVISPQQGSVPCNDNQQGTEPCNPPALVVEGEIESTTISARLAQLQNIEADNITARNIVADTIEANHIIGLDAKIASLSDGMSDSDFETITDRIKARLKTLSEVEGPTAEDIPIPEPDSSPIPYTAYSIPYTASSSATLASADIDFVTINDYLAVIGTATITELEVTDHLYATQIESKTGLLALGDNTLLIDSSGHVAINGDLTVSGTITASQLNLERLNIYDEAGTTVATIDASGSANLAALTTNMITIASPAIASQSGLATLLGTAQSNATAGQNILVSPNTELTIESPYVTTNSLVYLTPTGNTDNKVLFVKSKISCPPLESSSSLLESCVPSFTVGIDAPASSDISFNWWIIELASPSP